MSGLSSMQKRMIFDGGKTSDGRNVVGKYRSFKSALDNSYQAEWITFNGKKHRCLINPDKLTVDYDQKEISIDFCAGMQNGDVFYWNRTRSHWIVYLQRLEEEAYFRAQIRQCNYQINDWWVYLRGPVETALVWKQKHQIEFNEMNHSILIYVTSTAETNEFFKRFQIVKFDGHNWRVAATDRYSQPGLIEVYLEEYFDNDLEDDMNVPEIVEPNYQEPYIDGPQLVKPFDEKLSYSIINSSNGKFVVNSNKVKIKEMTESSCLINIITGKSGKFTISYLVGDETIAAQEITIQSL